ncbi:hypothetical protein [Streptomyces sp. 4F14]|uniref:hypothetical protein n=1 Tax=Streptomyces sp. 4F14 TaxID=3394380 RepID=UPI003A886C03
MVSDRRAPGVWHPLLVWGAMATVMPVLGFGLLAVGWGKGGGAVGVALLVVVPLVIGLLSVLAPASDVVPWCATRSGRIGWAVTVFTLGTGGVLAGLAAYGQDVDLGSAATRVALTGLPYAVVAAFLVPGRWVRAGAAAVLVAGVVYGGYVGPSQGREREQAAEVARYREHAEVLYLGVTPPGMRMVRAVVGGASFDVEYHWAVPDRSGYVGVMVRSPLSPPMVCPERAETGVSCVAGAGGEVREVRSLPGGEQVVTLFRWHEGAGVQVTGQGVGEAALRGVLDGLHPVSEGELEGLMREGVISEG